MRLVAVMLMLGGCGEDAAPERENPFPRGELRDDVTLGDGDYVLESSLDISGSLTIEGCATVEMRDSIGVHDSGSLILKGRDDCQVRLHGEPDSWQLAIGGTGTNVFDHVRMENAGYSNGAALFVSEESSLTMQDSEIIGSGTTGLVALGALPDFTGNTITQSAAYPIEATLQTLDGVADGIFSGNGVDAIRVRRTNGPVQADVTLAVTNVPYHVEYIFLNSGSLTVGPGVTLAFLEGADPIYVNGGTLHVAGTSGRRVTFTTAESFAYDGAWGFIQLNSTGNLIEHADIEYGGAPQILVEGSGGLTLDDVQFRFGDQDLCDIDVNPGGALTATNSDYDDDCDG